MTVPTRTASASTTGPAKTAALWLQRFTPPSGSYPLTLQHIQITWPSTGGVTPGLQARLVVYLDADGDGDPSNAVLLHQELVTVGSIDTFEDYPVNVPVTGPGDIYLGFEDYWAEGGYQPLLYPAAIDTDASQGRSWVAGMSNGNPPDINNLGNNDLIGTIDSFGLPGNWMIRASGDTGAIVYCPTNTPEPATATATTVPPTATATSVPPTDTETPVPVVTETETPVPGATNTATPVPPSATETPGPPTATETPCPLPFTDVHPADYFYVPVQYLYCHGVISGYADHTFRPYNSTTRSQMVKIVVLGFGLPTYTPPASGYTFADVHPDFPFYAVIETAAHDNVVSGYDCGGPGEPCDAQNRPYFRPYNNVTRGQLSKIDVVAAGWDILNPPDPSFTDVLPNTAFYEFVETAYCHGIISGYDCGGPGEPCDPQNRPYFRQYNDATRGQISKIVYLSIMSPPGTCPGPGPTDTPTP